MKDEWTNQIIFLFKKTHFETSCVGCKANIYLYLGHWFYVFQYFSDHDIVFISTWHADNLLSFQMMKNKTQYNRIQSDLEKKFVERFAKVVIGSINEKRFELIIAL